MGSGILVSLGDRLRSLLALKDSPHWIALSFSMGLAIGVSPLLGAHILLGLFVAWAFKLNKVATFTGVLAPTWTLLPIYSFSTWLGFRILGENRVIPEMNESQLGMGAIMGDLGSLLKPFVIGSFVTSVVSAVVGYGLVYWMVTTYRKRNQGQVLSLKDDEDPVS